MNNIIYYENNNISYRRISNELKNFNLKYKFNILDKGYNLEFNYKNNNINIFFNINYPFEPPSKLLINNISSDIIYKNIMKLNPEIIDCLCCKSNLCKHNWNNICNLKDNLINEVNLIIKYKLYFYYKKLLNQIINKYTNQDMTYLYKYLL